jgi:hypothetical protein
VGADRSVRAGEWTRGKFLGRELRGKTLGLVGLGRVGAAVARRAAPFEMKVVAHDPFATEAMAHGAGWLETEMPAFRQASAAFETGDQEMADGADIPLQATGVPVELDRIYASLRDLSQTLGPNGVNADGTLNNLLTVAADNLEGKGALGNKMIRDLSEAAETFGEGSGDLFATVNALAEFTGTLAANDNLVRAFLQDLAGVSSDLAGERLELERTLVEVARAVGTVRTFIEDNRDALVTDFGKLTRVVKTIASEKDSLNKALRAGPVGIGNLNSAFDVPSGSIGSRVFTQGNIGDADGFLCSVVQQSDLPKASKDLACQVFKQLLEPVGSQIYSGSSAPSVASRRGCCPSSAGT